MTEIMSQSQVTMALVLIDCDDCCLVPDVVFNFFLLFVIVLNTGFETLY